MSGGRLEFVARAAQGREQAAAIGAALAGMDPWRTLGYQAEPLARGLESAHPDLTHYLAMRDGELQGLVVVRHPWLRGAYIELFAVLPRAQGQGVGRARPSISSSRTTVGAPQTFGCWSPASIPAPGASTRNRAFTRSASSPTWWSQARTRC